MTRAELKTLAKQQLRGNWLLALVASLLVTVIISAITSIGMYVNFFSRGASLLAIMAGDIPYIPSFGGSVFYLICTIIAAFVAGVLALGLAKFYLNLTRNIMPEINTVFGYFPYILKAFGLTFMVGLFTFLWSLLLIVPGIVAAYRYRMAWYIMADDPEIGIMEAISQSKQMMMGHKGELFILDLSFIGWALLCGLTCGIGYLWLAPYMETTYANYYEYLRGVREAAPQY